MIRVTQADTDFLAATFFILRAVSAGTLIVMRRMLTTSA